MRDLTRRRVYSVAHGRDGFVLHVRDEHLLYEAAERANEALLAVLGHPCCGRGPLAKLHVSYRTLWRWNLIPRSWAPWILDDDGNWDVDPDDDALDIVWFDLLNLPNKLYRYGRWVADVPLTDEQALAIRPAVADWDWWKNEDEDDDWEIHDG